MKEISKNAQEKLVSVARGKNRIKYRIRNSLESVEKIDVPKHIDGCEVHNRVNTLSSFLSNEDYVNAQLLTEDGKDNLLMLLHSLEVSAVALRKMIREESQEENNKELC